MAYDFEDNLDVTKLKYALYLRKSTDDPERQVRSVEDQEAECRRMAKHMGLHIVEPAIIEKKSAKKPGLRPLFSKMLKDIQTGKYHGIISWNPDRLSRNMREGGEIIDMIDDDIIKDLRFVTHHFSKDANGKMLLGMAFVLSKQYSDKLSQDVTRGLHHKVEEGRSHIPKHGYFFDDEGYYHPHEENFALIQKAWMMRLEGQSLKTISLYLNNHGYKQVKKTGTIVRMTTQILSEVFKDPFFYGILLQGDKEVNLKALYAFKTMITEAEYLQVQKQSRLRIVPMNTRRHTFYPFKMMIKCSYCGGNMAVAPSPGETKRYLYARCDNNACTRVKKSARVKIVLDFIYDFLSDGLHLTENDYRKYYEETVASAEEKKASLDIMLHSKQAYLKTLGAEIDRIAVGVLDFEKGSTVRTASEKKLNSLVAEKEQIEEDILAIKGEMPNMDEDRLTLEEFLNLSKNAGIYVKKGDAVVKDYVCRFIFLNFSIDEEKVLNYQLKEPFATLLKTKVSLLSRGGETRTHDLLLPKQAL